MITSLEEELSFKVTTRPLDHEGSILKKPLHRAPKRLQGMMICMQRG